jgi:hypothetical protein
MTTATAEAPVHHFPIDRRWVMAGNATFTVKNATGDHYTFNVRQPAPTPAYPTPNHFLSVLTGPDHYTYVGVVEPLYDGGHLHVRLTGKSKYTQDSVLVRVADFALRVVCGKQDLPTGYGIDHMGCCGRCGHELTHPDGISEDGYRLGYGPMCWEIMNGGGQ